MGVRPQPGKEEVPVPASSGQPFRAADAHQRMALGLHHPYGVCAGAGSRDLHCLPPHRPLADGRTFHHRWFCSPSQARQ